MKLKKDVRDALINIALAFGIIFLQSWIAAGIEGNELFPWWPGGKLKPGNADFNWTLIGMSVLAIAFAALLYLRRRSFLPVQVLRIGEPGEVRRHQVLVLNISRSLWKWEASRLVHDRGSIHAIPASLSAALEAMSALGELDKFSGEQLLRAMAVHAPAPNRVILVGSAGENGTGKRFPECRDMFRYYFPALSEGAVEKREADFESLDNLLDVYASIIASEAHRKSEIMIDVTGGTKVVSIAAAMVTLKHPEIEFQYVETEGRKRVRSFNVTTARDPEM